MTIIELEAHRRTITTPQAPLSCIDVDSGPVALFVHGLGINALLWNRRQLAIPGGEPFELPITGRRALEGAGFDIIEQGQPSFLFDRSR
jgi:hypothetical protein